jgi:hypothetical protein
MEGLRNPLGTSFLHGRRHREREREREVYILDVDASWSE